MRPVLLSKDGAQLWHAEPAAGAVDQALEDLLHLVTSPEQQIAAVLKLVHRVVVAKARALLVRAVQGEAQAAAVDPAVAHRRQSPYHPRLGQGVCDCRQGLRLGHPGERVSCQIIRDSGVGRLQAHVLVPIQDDLRAEGRMARHLDGEVPPLRIQDVKGVVLDERFLGPQVAQHAPTRPRHLPHGRDRARNQDQKQPLGRRMVGQVLPGYLVLALIPAAVHHRDLVRLSESTHPTAEPAGQAHQVGVVQIVIRPTQASPPAAETACVVAEHVVAVEHDAVHTVVAPRQQVGVLRAQRVTHWSTLPLAGEDTRPAPPAQLLRQEPLVLSGVSEPG